MAVTRQKLLASVEIFKDKAAMRTKYGININDSQIQAAEKLSEQYQRMSSKDIEKLPDDVLNKWPYRMTELQKYERLLAKAPLTITQTLLWQHIRKYLADNPDQQKRDGPCIVKALKDLEELLQLNVYRGEFKDNQTLLDGQDIEYLMKLFTLSYTKYINEKRV